MPPRTFGPALRELWRTPRWWPSARSVWTITARRRRPGIWRASRREQAEIFRQQLEVAAELGLNCIIHQRDSFDDTLEQARPWAGRVCCVFHCFSESGERLQRVLDLGWMVSFTGIITFKNGGNARDALAATPMDRFMLETDCPFLAPVPWRGKRCEPAYVSEIARTAAEVKKCSLRN